MQNFQTHERLQETMALLKILALGNQQIEEKKIQPAKTVIKRIRKRQNT